MGQFAEYLDGINKVPNKAYSECEEFTDESLKKFKHALKKGSEADIEELKLILLACISNGNSDLLTFAVAIVDARKIFKWKQHEALMGEIIDSVTEHGKKADPNGDRQYGDFMDKVVTIIKGNQLLQKMQNKLHTMLMLVFKHPDSQLTNLCRKFTEHLPWGQETEWALEFMDKSFEVMQENPEMKSDDNMALFIIKTFEDIYRNVSKKKKQAVKYKDHIAKIFNWAKDQEWIDEDDSEKRTTVYDWLKNCLEDYLMGNIDSKEIIEPVFKACQELWECDDEYLRRDANNLMKNMSASLMAEFGDDASDKLVERAINGEDPALICNFNSMYKSSPETLNPHLEAIAENMEGAEDWVLTTTIGFFLTVCTEHPEAMTAKCVQHLINTLKVKNTSSIALMALAPLAEKRPQLLAPYDDAIIENMKTNQVMASQGARILVHLSEESAKKTAKYLAVLKTVIGKCESSTYKIGLVYTMKTIGAIYPEELAKYKKFFEKMMSDPVLKDFAESALDTIAGRSLAAVTNEVDEVQQDVAELDERVTNTEENVTNLEKEVDSTKVEVVALSGELNEQGQRLEELEDVVEETVTKVEEIDKKTLSHAPIWSRDVAKLLNQQSEHDWRLLGRRLGYSNDDIRNWATQPDPCLSMFDEWFATNKTREATHAILKHLEEMDRMDAFLIVENALKQTEGVVEDEEVEYATPPPVFISYQWGLQEEVKLLKNHLEMAGFEGWIDIGQMGGGDKLFEKIDTGIRAAKVIICCVSEKYAKSPNCNREVNLSVNLSKPIIPLLMEKMPWPPKGSMGPIFGEYLFIRFFSRGGEESGDNRYWPLPKMQELLMQIRYNVVPNEELFKKPYLNWMSPPAEIIILKPKEKKDSGKAVVKAKNTESEDEESPDVFISYQWGKQRQIKALYTRLSQLGYTCWLDILQMGGGDSLYDKIDKGVRGCKVVLTCVTSKYALSANCRREVSLADALKKPVIPLLLEKMTWPPEGSMSMVFTQLLYINFYSPDVSIQNSWDCPQLEELKAKIQAHIPQIEYCSEPTKKGDSADVTKKHQTATIGTVKNEEKKVKDAAPVVNNAPQQQKAEQTNITKVNKEKTGKYETTPVVDNTSQQQKEEQTNTTKVDEVNTGKDETSGVDNTSQQQKKEPATKTEVHTSRSNTEPQPKKSSSCCML